jgi:5'-3' exonuclease
MSQKLQITQEQLDFKSNSISPGTQFMIELSSHIDFFIKRKIHEDPEWRNLNVVFSDGNCPGEGEHKIMNYIRAMTPSQSLRDTHCIYGNDSDLIMLGLKLHLPNIFILKEPNVFVDKDRMTNYAAKRFEGEQKLEVIYINLLREYLMLEFLEDEFKKKFTEKFKGTWGDFGKDLEKNRNTANLERFIDDFVFLTCFIGNDFFPNLYGLSTKNGDLDVLIKELKKFYENEGVFLIFREEIQYHNVLLLLKQIQNFQNRYIQRCSGIFRREISNYDKKKKMLSKNTSSKEEGVILANDDEADTDLFLLRYKSDFNELKSAHARIKKMISLENNIEERQMFYYLNYFNEGAEIKDSAKCTQLIKDICKNYFEAMKFIHLYYTIGCPSWTWSYRYSICPLLPDMINFLENHLKKYENSPPFSLQRGSPFKPFVQLIHILPKDSLGLIPPIFKNTLFKEYDDEHVEASSSQEEIDYSLFSFKGDKPEPIDLKNKGSIARIQKLFSDNFKVHSVDNIRPYMWHPNVGNIREEDMMKFLMLIDWDTLTPNEKKRNSFGLARLYKFDEKESQIVVPTLPGFENSLISFKVEEFDYDNTHKPDIRKLDRNYLRFETVLGLTRFKSPSFLRKFGGFENVTLKRTIKHKREILFLVIKAKILRDILVNTELEESIEKHLDDIKKSKNSKEMKTQSLKLKSK